MTRQAWSPHIDLRDSHLLVLAASQSQLLQSEYEEYVAANNGSLACLRSVALIVSKTTFFFFQHSLNLCSRMMICLSFGNLCEFFFWQLLFILLLRQALMLTRDSGMMQESSAFINVSTACYPWNICSP